MVPAFAMLTVTKSVRKKIMKTSITLLTLALMGTIAIANAQERLSTDQAKRYAELTRQSPSLLKNAPLKFEADLDQPVAVAMEDLGGLVIPRVDLSEGSEADVGVEPVAIGEMWLYNLTLEQNGWGISENKLDVISLKTEEGRVKVPRCVLGVNKPDGKTPVLLVYGKSEKPLLKLPLTKIQKTSSSPLDLSATDQGKVTLSILGEYQATFSVTELFL